LLAKLFDPHSFPSGVLVHGVAFATMFVWGESPDITATMFNAMNTKL
jgi:hypothetical protein